MRIRAFYLLTAGTLCGLSLFGQQIRETIPFRLTEHNNIAVRVKLNGSDSATLMFHTAASSVTLTEDAVRKFPGLQFGRTDSVDSWGGEANGSRYSRGNRLEIGRLVWNDLDLWETKYSGPGTDGKFGPDLFAGKVTEIDFDRGLITLHDSLPRKLNGYDRLNFIFENGMPFLEAACEMDGKRIRNRFLIHSGYAGSVLLDDAFVTQNRSLGMLEVTDEKELRDSYGNVLKTKKALLPAFIIGKYRLRHVPVGYFEGAIGRQKMSVIGADLLKRFHLFIDFGHRCIYLKPGRLVKVPYGNA